MKKKLKQPYVVSQEFKSFVENAPDIIVRYDKKTRCLYANKMVEIMAGIPAENFIGKTSEQIGLQKNFIKKLNKSLEYIFKKRKDTSFCFVYKTPKGIRTFQINLVPEFDLNSKIISVLSIIRDITKQKNIEKELRQSEENLRLFIKHAPCMIYEINFYSPQFINVNDTVCKVLGYTREELLTMNPFDLLNNESKILFKERIKKQLTGECIPESEVYLGKNKKGNELYLILHVSFSYKEGKPQGAIIIAHDITERIKLERRKSDFISMASHELKTPITTIKVFAQILEKRLIKSGESENVYFLQNIDEQIDKINNLIGDLLDVNKIEAGKMAFNMRKFDIDNLIKKVIIDFQYTSETHQIERVGEVNKKIIGDEDRIAQVLINLLSNAIKYSSNANKIIVSVSSNSNQVKVSVQDFGFGIPKFYHKKIFERFFRLSGKHSKNISGFGMGLYISNEIIKRHGGKIWVESEKGKGSTFLFTLPIK